MTNGYWAEILCMIIRLFNLTVSSQFDEVLEDNHE